MIVVDGSEYTKDVQHFGNLEELLSDVTADAVLEGRTVTDVLVNNELFSEIYPHQAEDITSDLMSSVEIRSMPDGQMAQDMVGELDKVCRMMMAGARNVARLFRQAEDSSALELLQDLLDVTRDFMAMQQSLRTEYHVQSSADLGAQMSALDALLSEMGDVLAQEDWVLLADLLEYEFQPQCEAWQRVIAELRQGVTCAVKQ